jgi:hypothetical protein
MKRISVAIEGKAFVVRVPIQEGKLSKSGMNKIIATSHGMVATNLIVEDQPVIVNLNAFIRVDEDEEVDEEEPAKEATGMKKSNRKKKK